MKDYKLSGWQDYWKVFDKLIEELSSDKQTEIITELKEVQKHINGLTDSWYEFKFSFEKVLKSNRENMTKEQNEIADFLLTTLSKSLSNR